MSVIQQIDVLLHFRQTETEEKLVSLEAEPMESKTDAKPPPRPQSRDSGFPHGLEQRANGGNTRLPLSRNRPALHCLGDAVSDIIIQGVANDQGPKRHQSRLGQSGL
jgi:hypothetical protein